MAYQGKSLKDLMDEARAQQADIVVEEDDLFEEKYTFSPEPEKPLAVRLEECIRKAFSDLSGFHLSEEEQRAIREFLTFRILTKYAPDDQPEAHRAYYNLLVHTDEPESVYRFVDILCAALQIRMNEVEVKSEQELILAASSGNVGAQRKIVPSPLRCKLLLINDCKDAPRLNLDGNGSARDASKKAIENYNRMWSTVFSAIRRDPEIILIVSCDEDTYRHTLRPFSELSQRICRQHIHLPVPTEEDLLKDCMTELRNSSFSIADDFEPALRQYFLNAYRNAELRSGAFVADAIDQIYAQYYSYPRGSHTLDADCVPKYDPVAHSVESILGQLDQLVGLQTVKEEFRNIYRMQIAGLVDPEHTHYHMLFTGNPGTGKTTVARLAADLFFRMGILKSNKLITVKPSDLVSEWSGGTGTKAMDVIRRAYNGVLFIDEAYGFATMSRGEESLNILLQEMENNSDKLIVILAGYTDEMRDLLKTNPGLGSRFNEEIHFQDYTPEELAKIFLLMCKKDGFTLDPTAKDELDDCISLLMTREFFGNARDIRTMLQDLKEAWSADFYDAYTKHGYAQDDVKRVFLPHHFEKIMPPKKEVSIQDMIGLDVLKAKLNAFKRQALYQKHLREKGFEHLSDFSMHMIFTGNPGTGKTTVAKLIADDLYSIGMLKTNRLVVAERKDLVSIPGGTAQKTADVIRKAVGGVLFIDEAYSLSANRYCGDECIEVLLTAMEEHKSDTVFVFAGYVEEMQEFLLSNPGLQSRIGYTFHFENYSPAELTQMYTAKMQKMGFTIADDATRRLQEIMEYFHDIKHFGNGRFVDHVIHQTISQRANRDFSKEYRNIQAQDIPSVKDLIDTAPNSMHLYDPAEITPEERRRTAVHEVGHAIAIVATDPQHIPKSISIRNQAGSLGRVSLSLTQINQTEEQLLHHLITLLSGKNAEKCIFGTHDTGCANDYDRAKYVADSMVTKYAMVSYGETAEDILKAADRRSMDILQKHSDHLVKITDMLISKRELTGSEFMMLMAEEA